MKIPHYLIAAALAAGTSHGATTFTENFEGFSPGAIDAETLSAANSEGTWSFNTGRGATYTIVDIAGNQSFLMEDTDGGNFPTRNFSTLTLTDAVDFTASPAQISFTTGSLYDYFNDGRVLHYQFLNGSGDVAASITWDASGAIAFNGVSTGQTTTSYEESAAMADTSTAVNVSASFSGSTVTLQFGDVTDTVAVMNGASDLGRLRIQTRSDFGNQEFGVYLDNIAVIPEPSTALLGGLFGLAALVRRRR